MTKVFGITRHRKQEDSSNIECPPRITVIPTKDSPLHTKSQLKIEELFVFLTFLNEILKYSSVEVLQNL